MDLKYVVMALVLMPYYSAISKAEPEKNVYDTYCHRSDCEPISNTSKFYEFCHNGGLLLDGRCCIEDFNSTSNITYGIDFSSCNIRKLQEDMFISFPEMKVLMLQDNPIEEWSILDFVGMKGLQELYLPLTKHVCPGGEGAWGTINIIEDNVQCLEEKDACIGLNLTCPDNSYCIHAGPGSAQCLCNEGYYGYKCLRTGKFPMEIYAVSCAIGLAGVILFGVIMRRFKSKNKQRRRKERRQQQQPEEQQN